MEEYITIKTNEIHKVQDVIPTLPPADGHIWPMYL